MTQPDIVPVGDAVLIDAARRGDADAVSALFARHGGALFRLAYRVAGSREDAEDVVQDVFLGLRRAARRYEERGAVLPWLRRVTVRVALMRMRADRTRRAALAAWGGVPQPPAGPADRLTLRLALSAALAALPLTLRAVFVLREVEGFTHDEIADLLHITPSASKVRLHRAVRRLRALLREDR